MNSAKRNYDVNVIGAKSKKIVVHVENGTMSLDQAGRFALAIAKAIGDAQPNENPHPPCAID